MKPPPRIRMEYEKVNIQDWVPGIIEDIQHDEERETGFKDEKTGEPLIKDCIRFKFQLEGCSYPHYSRWMTFSYHEKANLYKKYLSSLVEGAKPDMDFDLDRLKGMKIKTMWANNGEFQNLEMIRPVDKKLDGTIPF